MAPAIAASPSTKMSGSTFDFMLVGVDRAIAGLVGQRGIARDLAGHLRRHDIDEGRPWDGSQGPVVTVHGGGIDLLEAAVHLGVLSTRPCRDSGAAGRQEQRHLRELLLGVDDDDAATWRGPWISARAPCTRCARRAPAGSGRDWGAPPSRWSRRPPARRAAFLSSGHLAAPASRRAASVSIAASDQPGTKSKLRSMPGATTSRS